jgi:hypothetical protein
MGSAQSQNTLYNTLTSSITQTMSQKVDASTSVICQNIQEVNDASGCSITFGKQLCKATGVADVTTDANFTAIATQDVMNTLEQTALAKTSGLFPSPSKASNFTQNLVNVATTTVQSFNTNCSKTASALNRQSVSNCKDSTIQFAVQESDVSVMGSCAATAAASTESFNKVTNAVTQAATAEAKGVDPFALLMMMALGFLFVMLAPKLMRSVVSSWNSNDGSAESKQREASSARLIVIVVLFGVYLFLVWPGVLAVVLNVRPWPPAVVNYKEDFCTNGTAGRAAAEKFNVDPDAFINDFAFWDNTCATLPAGTFCDASQQARHYKSCGIFSDLCDDPQARIDKEQYALAFAACGELYT